jgi:hypothetical protein
MEDFREALRYEAIRRSKLAGGALWYIIDAFLLN